jgi:hypothetical protein
MRTTMEAPTEGKNHRGCAHDKQEKREDNGEDDGCPIALKGVGLGSFADSIIGPLINRAHGYTGRC